MFTLVACNDTEQSDPVPLVQSISQSDSPEFRFIMNHEYDWFARWDDEPEHAFTVFFNETNGDFALYAHQRYTDDNGDVVDQSLVLDMPSHGVGLYFVEPGEVWFEDKQNCGIYHPEWRINDAFLKIGRLNAIKNTIAGAFDFYLVNRNCSDTLKLTQGFFNTTYREW